MRILVAEDERTINNQISSTLAEHHYAVDSVFDGKEALYKGLNEPYDAIVLDLGLPHLDGINVLNQWRDNDIHTPVIILTARDSWSEKVIGIDSGADDYLTKPFHMEELLARIRALIRRSTGNNRTVLKCGAIELNVRTGKVLIDGTSISLTSHEFKVLSYLMHHQDEIVSRTELTEHIYAQDFDRDSNTIEVFVGRLRKKLPPGYIETIRGSGYRFTEPS